jgi:hypothetical protein
MVVRLVIEGPVLSVVEGQRYEKHVCNNRYVDSKPILVPSATSAPQNIAAVTV